MCVKDQIFDDIFLHSQALETWSLEYCQLSNTPFQSRLIELDLGSVRIFREQMNCKMTQFAKTPSNTVSFLIPISCKNSSNLLGLKKFSARKLPINQDFFLFTTEHIDYVVIEYDLNFLKQHLKIDQFHRVYSQEIQCDDVINAQLSEMIFSRFSKLLDCYTQAPFSISDTLKTQHCLEFLSYINQYFEVKESSGQTVKRSSYHCFVQQIYTIIHKWDSAPSIQNICKIFNVPQRTLNYFFEKNMGITANQFIRAIKLNRIDQILHQQKKDVLLTDLAHQFGFSHSSHFGREYKKLFGRTPSALLK